MELVKRNFTEVLKDNDELYFIHLGGVIESIDEYASVDISRTPHSYHFRIAPSIPMYIEPLLKEILKLNNLFNIHLDLSKSIKASSAITFDIEINN